MMRPDDEDDLFSAPPLEALARTSDPETSHGAAAEVNVNHLEAEVCRAVGHYGQHGANCWEVACFLGLSLQSITPRMAPLRKKGKLKRKFLGTYALSGKPVFETRKGETNRATNVHYLPEWLP